MLFGVLKVSSRGYRALTDMMAVLCYMAEADCCPMAMGDMHAGALIDRPRLHRPPSVLPTFVLVAFVTCWRQPERYLVLLEANNGQDATGFVPLP